MIPCTREKLLEAKRGAEAKLQVIRDEIATLEQRHCFLESTLTEHFRRDQRDLSAAAEKLRTNGRSHVETA